MNSCIGSKWILGMLISLGASFIPLQAALAVEKSVVFSSTERAPYIGPDLRNNGYVQELAETVFKNAGYKVEVQLLPQSRAVKYAQSGKVDGILPFYADDKSSKDFIFSDPFPGDAIGLLKQTNFEVPNYGNDGHTVENRVDLLKPFSIGVVRGARVHPSFDDESNGLNKWLAKHDLQNIDKLGLARLDMIAIDPYTAADTLVNFRPHLIGQLEFMQPLLVQHKFHIAFSKKGKDAEAHIKAFNTGLAKLKADGTLQKIMESHGLFGLTETKEGIQRLTIGTVNNGDMQVMEHLSQEYEKENPNIDLVWRVMDENTLRTRLLSDLAISDGQFDVMTIGAYEAPIWAEKGWITHLKDLPAEYELNDVLPNVRGGLTVEDNLYALPFYAESSMTFYRKDLFEQAGVQMPEKPTYDDILKFAQKIHQPEKGQYGICLRGKAGWGENMALITTMANAYGGRWFDEEWTPGLASSAWANAIDMYINLLKNYGPPNPELNGFNENRILFSKGQCGMWIDATVAAGMLFNPKLSEVSDQLGFAPAPMAKTDKGSNWLWIWSLAIPSSSNNQQAALDFITWATSKDYIQNVAKANGWVSAPPGTRASTYAADEYKAAAPFADFVLKAIQEADPKDSTLEPSPYSGIQFVGIHEFPSIGHQVGLLVSEVLQGNMPAKKALKKAQGLTKKQMKKSGYYD